MRDIGLGFTVGFRVLSVGLSTCLQDCVLGISLRASVSVDLGIQV